MPAHPPHVPMLLQVQCVMHFLQMPIEDDLIAELLPRQPPGVLLSNAGPSWGLPRRPSPSQTLATPSWRRRGWNQHLAGPGLNQQHIALASNPFWHAQPSGKDRYAHHQRGMSPPGMRLAVATSASASREPTDYVLIVHWQN